MSTGVAVPAGIPIGDVLALADAAEALGFAGIWVGELNSFDAFALATAIAQRTGRIEVVVGPLPAATRSPAQLAMGIACVTEAGRRPAHLALGASSPAIVEGWHGRRWRDVVSEAAATVDRVRGLLAGERDEGGFRLRFPSPATSIYLAGQGPRMRAVAAVHADGLVLNLVAPSQVEAGAAVWLPVSAPGDEGFEQRRSVVQPYVAAPGYRASMAELTGGRPVEEAVDIVTGAVTAAVGDELAGRLADHAASGTGTVVVMPVAVSGSARLEVLAAAAEVVTQARRPAPPAGTGTVNRP